MRLRGSGRVFICALSLLFAACGSRRGAIMYHTPISVPSEMPAGIPTPVVTDTTPDKEEQQQTVPEMESTSMPLVNYVERSERGTWRGEIQYTLDSLCRTSIFETTQLGLYVFDITENRPLYAVNAGQRMRPASNQKVVTAVSALHFLKGDYRMNTDVFINGTIQNATLQGDIYVRGCMDPLLSPYDVDNMAAALKSAGISRVCGHLYVDLSMKDDLAYGWGWCWDDDYGPLSALMVDGKDCFAQQWLSALHTSDIATDDELLLSQPVPKTARKVFTVSHSLDELLVPMMKNSDNIYAECLFYQIAASTGVKKAGRKQAASRIQELIGKLGLTQKRYQIADGSGLSLYNYVSAELLVRMLNHAYVNEPIRQHLLPSLPIAGEDGTLSKRMKDTPAAGNVKAKTGTVDGISSLSGYLTASNGHILSFSIINQGIIYTSTGKDFQDKVCIRLCQ